MKNADGLNSVRTPRTILTPKLRLTPAEPRDAPDLAGLELDPDVMRFLGPPALPEGASAPFWRPRGGEAGVWTARHRADEEFVGWFALIPVPDHPSTAELGYRLARHAWGRGLATEGAHALVRLGFADLGLDRIEATTMAVNVASRRVLEKLGFVHVETRHFDWPDPLPGSAEGDVVYRLEAPH